MHSIYTGLLFIYSLELWINLLYIYVYLCMMHFTTLQYCCFKQPKKLQEVTPGSRDTISVSEKDLHFDIVLPLSQLQENKLIPDGKTS